MTRRFHIADVLTVTTGVMLSDDGIGSVYELVDYVTGVAHMTHQLPRACDAIRPHLVAQHPWLAEVTKPSFPDDHLRANHVRLWLLGKIARYGQFHDVEPLPPGAYAYRDPTDELRELAPHLNVIVIPLIQEEDRDQRPPE